MVGIDDAEAARLVARHRAQPHRASVCGSHGADGAADDPRLDGLDGINDIDGIDDIQVVEGPDDVELDTVTRLMGFLRGDEPSDTA